MAQTDTRKLDSEDPFPRLALDLVGGGQVKLPGEAWTLLLIYRGRW